jgi:hypothetical protein
MELEPWIRQLHAKVGPPGQSTDRVVAYLQPRLQDLNPFWFTNAAIEDVFLKLRTLNSADRVRKALHDFHARQPPPTPPTETPMQRDWRNWQEQQKLLAKEWDDPNGIMRKVRDCADNPVAMRMLARIIARHAPQHLGCIPPHVLHAMHANGSPDLRAVLHGMPPDPHAPERSPQQQREALTPPATSLGPRHLTPAQLDVVNPLPNGLKRIKASNTA